MTTSTDDALGQATPTTDGAAVEAEPSPAQRYLDALVVVPGAEHVVVVDASGQRVLAEWGEPGDSTRAVLERARRAADPSSRGRRQLEDVTWTTASAFHFSCLVLAGPGHPRSVWVALRVDRSRGHLNWSKWALARLSAPGGRFSPVTPADAAPAVVPGAVDDEGRPPAEAAAAPAPTVVSPPVPPAPRMPSAIPSTSPEAAPSKARIALTARATPPTATAPEVPGRLPAPAAAAAPTTSSGDDPDTAHTAVAEPAPTVEMVTPPVVPAARTSSENHSAAAPREPQRNSSFAPVMVVLPPPAPIPDDGTFEEPAPMPAPIIVAPDLPVAGRPVAVEVEAELEAEVEAEVTVGAGSDEGGAGRPRPVRVVPSRTPEVRQPAGRVPAPVPAAPSRPPAPGTTAPAPTHEPSITRRLIHGLRRRS